MLLHRSKHMKSIQDYAKVQISSKLLLEHTARGKQYKRIKWIPMAAKFPSIITLYISSYNYSHGKIKKKYSLYCP